MPSRPMKPCSKIGCPELTNNKYCSKHTDQVKDDKAEANKHYDKTIRYSEDNIKYSKFYHSGEWAIVRKQALSRDLYLCRDCYEFEKKITLGDVVDHIVEIKDKWDLRLSMDNLRTRCHKHHNEKTAKVKKERESKDT
jgi:5-methylcytosine-specific restriction enzyme A